MWWNAPRIEFYSASAPQLGNAPALMGWFEKLRLRGYTLVHVRFTHF